MAVYDWEEFVAAAKAQHRGGYSFSRGAGFQVFAEALELLRFATSVINRPMQGDPLFQSEVEGSRVDDLHIIFDEFNLTYRYQMKAVANQEWTLKLETQFKQEAHFFPDSQFILAVHNEDTAKKLHGSKADHALDFVRVIFHDIDAQKRPFDAPFIRKRLDKLIAAKEKHSHHLATWTALFGTWDRLRGGRFSEIWSDICEASKYDLVSLTQTSGDVDAAAHKFDVVLPTLSISADGEIVTLSDEVFFARARLPLTMSLADKVFWRKTPTNEWEFFEMLGAFAK